MQNQKQIQKPSREQSRKWKQNPGAELDTELKANPKDTVKSKIRSRVRSRVKRSKPEPVEREQSWKQSQQPSHILTQKNGQVRSGVEHRRSRKRRVGSESGQSRKWSGK